MNYHKNEPEQKICPLLSIGKDKFQKCICEKCEFWQESRYAENNGYCSLSTVGNGD